MAKNKKDILESFHEHDINIPTRTIHLATSYSDDDGAAGVNHFMVTKFMKNFMHLEETSSDPITVILNTTGGDVIDGMAIYDLIKGSDNHVTICVLGQASSIGSVILQAADDRVLYPNAAVMFHAGGAGGSTMNPHEALNYADFEKKYGERTDKILYDRINDKREKTNQAKMSWSAFSNMNLKGKYMTAEEAIALGLADRIKTKK